MKSFGLICIALLIFGCSKSEAGNGTHTVGDPMSMPGGQEPTANQPQTDVGQAVDTKTFENDVFKVAMYPGAEEVPNTRMMSDIAGYACSFKSNDDVEKVAKHFETEGEKIGNLVKMPLDGKEGFRVVSVQIKDGSRLQIQISKSKEGFTFFSVHLRGPSKS